ncbi:MAG: hypothetical protein MK135_15555 [Polyangiaceae bacterium]|nr:hypothetical protein [Polyangiaceae bacterium]
MHNYSLKGFSLLGGFFAGCLLSACGPSDGLSPEEVALLRAEEGASTAPGDSAAVGAEQPGGADLMPGLTPLPGDANPGDAADSGGVGTPTTTPTGSSGAGQFGQEIQGGSTASGFEIIDLTIGDDKYLVQANPWRSGTSQTLSVGQGKVFSIDSLSTSAPDPYQVMTFPSVYKGVAQGRQRSEGSNLPKAISELTTIPTGMKTNTSAINFGGNATYDVYFTYDENYSGGGSPDIYLMVWFSSNAMNPLISGGDYSCSGQPPTHLDACTDQGSLTVGGKTFHRFYGATGSSPVISYVAETPMDEWEFDLKNFIDDATANNYVDSSMYLQSVQGGFEVISGGVGLTMEDFYVTIN